MKKRKKLMDRIMSEITVVMPTYRRRWSAQYMVEHVLHRPFLLVVNEGREDEDLPPRMPSGVIPVVMPGSRRGGAVAAMEEGIMRASTRLVCVLNDDMEVVQHDWLEQAARVYREQLGDADGVVGIRDGIQGENLAAFAVMSVEFYRHYIFPAPYRGYYVDKEWTTKARMLGVLYFAKQAYIKHLNYAGTDATICRADKLLYQERMVRFDAERS
jgi:GT2 family glycosyltransferase